MSEIIKVTVIGAGGRMGRRVVQAVINADGIELVGAIEAKEGFVGHTVPGTEVLFTLSGRGESRSLFSESDVIIDVSNPGVTMKHITLALETEKPLVIGTTGLDDETTNYFKNVDLKIPCVLAPNFSIGANSMFVWVAQIMTVLGDGYDVEIVEAHHDLKKDAPSGTAKRLAEIIAKNRGWKLEEVACYGRQGMIGARPKNQIGIHSLRMGDVVGEHTVIFAGPGERIELTHRVSSRDAFAQGAVRAAMWIVKQKPGLYDMQDVLGLR